VSDICQSCGLCCDGTLFVSVPLEAGEVDWARGRQLPMFEKEGVSFFRQRCACFAADGLCSAYDSRPAACRRFRCHLLRRLEAGEVTENRARAAVEQAKQLRDRTTEELPGDESLLKRVDAFVKSLGDSKAPPDGALLAFRREKRQLISDVVVLSLLLQQEFRGPKKDGQSDGKTEGDRL